MVDFGLMFGMMELTRLLMIKEIDKIYTAYRQSSLFTFLTLWRFWEATEEEARKPIFMVLYGRDNWPSKCEWIVPQ